MEYISTIEYKRWTRFDLRVSLKKELEIKNKKLSQYIEKNQKNISSKNLYVHKRRLEISKLEAILRYV